MTDIRAAMKLIGGVEPSPQTVQRVQAIAHSVGFAENDPMYPILIVLDCYFGAFKEMPERAAKAADAAANAVSTKSRVAADRAVHEAMQSLTPAVEKALGSVAARVTARQMYQWGAGAFAVAFICIGLTFWYAHSAGVEDGRVLGCASSFDTPSLGQHDALSAQRLTKPSKQ